MVANSISHIHLNMIQTDNFKIRHVSRMQTFQPENVTQFPKNVTQLPKNMTQFPKIY